CDLLAALIISWILGQSTAVSVATATDAPLDLSSLERIEVQPQTLELHGPRERAIVLVTGFFPNGLVVDLTRQAQIASTHPTIAVYREGAVSPTGNGKCELVVQVAKQKVPLPVEVEGFDRPAPISFR